MDVIASNFYDRFPFILPSHVNLKVTCLNDYLEMDGLVFRITPTKIESLSQLPSIYGYRISMLTLPEIIVPNKWNGQLLTMVRDLINPYGRSARNEKSDPSNDRKSAKWLINFGSIPNIRIFL